MSRAAAILLVLSILAACDGRGGPPLEISDVDVFAPLPGSNMSAAYMTLANNTAETIIVQNFSSPDFAAVELHRTQIVDGVSRMHSLDNLAVPARSTTTLDQGGTHLMLMGPTTELRAGQPVSLRLDYDSEGVVIVSATLQARIQLEEPR